MCLLASNNSSVLYMYLYPCRKSLNLSETLLRLAEAGHYETVKSLFSFPLKHCPDVLLLALLQINVSTTFHSYIITCMHCVSYRHLVRSVGKVPICKAKGRRFESQLVQHSGSLTL